MVLVQFIANLVSRLRRLFSAARRAEDDPRHTLGRRGEKLAAKFLRRQGFKILYRNFRAPRGGEVDIVCRDRAANTLTFIEVKTRSSTYFGSPAEAVNLEKQHLITRGALAWLRMLDNPNIFFRFDIVEIVITPEETTCNLIRDAFQLPDPYIY